MSSRRDCNVELRGRVRRRQRRQIGRQRGGRVDLGKRVIHRQVNERESARAERWAGLFAESICVADAIRFEGNCIPEQDWVRHRVPFVELRLHRDRRMRLCET